MNTNTFKGYFLTVLCGLLVFAIVIFLILQWPAELQSKFSIYGKHVTVPTIWMMLGAAVGGLVFLMMCWLLAKGIGILYVSRRDEAREQKQIMSAVQKTVDDEKSREKTSSMDEKKSSEGFNHSDETV